MLTTTSMKTFTFMTCMLHLSVHATRNRSRAGPFSELARKVSDDIQYDYTKLNVDDDAKDPEEWQKAVFVGDPTGYFFKSRKARNSALKIGATAAGAAGTAAASVLTFGAGAAVMGGMMASMFGVSGLSLTAAENSTWDPSGSVKYTFKREKEGKGKKRLFVKLEQLGQDSQYAILKRIIPDQNSKGKKKKIKFVFEKLEGGRVCDRWIYPNHEKSHRFRQWLQVCSRMTGEDGKPYIPGESAKNVICTVRNQYRSYRKNFSIYIKGNANEVTENPMKHLMKAIFKVKEDLKLKLKADKKGVSGYFNRVKKWWNNSTFSPNGKRIGKFESFSKVEDVFGLEAYEGGLYEAEIRHEDH